jgi:hypothetical protein
MNGRHRIALQGAFGMVAAWPLETMMVFAQTTPHAMMIAAAVTQNCWSLLQI